MIEHDDEDEADEADEDKEEEDKEEEDEEDEEGEAEGGAARKGPSAGPRRRTVACAVAAFRFPVPDERTPDQLRRFKKTSAVASVRAGSALEQSARAAVVRGKKRAAAKRAAIV